MEHVTNPTSNLNTTRFALGIDVSRDKLDLALLLPDEKLHTKSVLGDERGFQALVRWVARLAGEPSAVHVCLEASGGYEEPAALFLVEQSFAVSVLNPRQIKAYADTRLRRSKTDRTDAALIARFCQRERPPLWQVPSPQLRHLRGLTRARDALKRDRDRLRNRRQRVGQGPAGQAHEAVIETLQEQITALEEAIEAHVEAHPDLARERDLLVTIPGIGSQTAAVVLSELGQVRRFENARQAAAYAGLVPSHHISGTSVKRRSRLSKLGNARLRHALYFPALTALRHNEAVAVLGRRLRAAGKVKIVVVGAAMRKLVHICYGVLRSGEPFDASLHPAT